MNQQISHDRILALTAGLCLDGVGLEIAPLYRPTIFKSERNILYTDYTTAEESRAKHGSYEHDGVVEIDFVWTPGARLADCVPEGLLFDYAIASHVIEHVPNPVGWVLQILDVLKVGGVLSLAAPDKRHCMDHFRRETDSADLIDAWVRNEGIPSPRQLFDFLSRSYEGGFPISVTTGQITDDFADVRRHYTDDQALGFVAHAWENDAYLDCHCSAFTPQSFRKTFTQLVKLGILNASVSEPVENPLEFFVRILKLGEPAVRRPRCDQRETDLARVRTELAHAQKAFFEAVAIQDQLKAELERARRSAARIALRKVKSWIKRAA